MKYQNPVVRGFYPDPSVCRAGEYFYLVNSTFEYFPAVPVFKSHDLVHWTQISYCISRNNQLKLYTDERQSAGGIYAPSIRYKDGRFYMVVTNMTGTEEYRENGGNFYVWTDDPAGEWSDPVFLGTGGIDPSMFFDDDGKDYYVGTSDGEIYISRIDLQAGKIAGERIPLWRGTGGSYPEGPHIYKRNNWYYLLISEGGTERSHMITMARSRKIEGPYEPCPSNPVLTNRSLPKPIESVGHADLVEDQHGGWWAVCLGTRTFSYPPKHNLGRETMLVPVDWSGEWPVFGNNGVVEREFDAALPAEDYSEQPGSYCCEFDSEKLDFGWNYIYNPQPEMYSVHDNTLWLLGNEHSIGDKAAYTWLARRQREHLAKVSVELAFPAENEGEEAGLSIFMNHRHHYDAAIICRGGKRCLIFRRQIGSLVHEEPVIELDTDTAVLEIEADLNYYSFYYTIKGGERRFLGRGETVYITTEVGGSFTGNYFALYAMGNGKKSCTQAGFRHYRSDEKDDTVL